MFITKTPMEQGQQCGYPENVDVTEEVANAIAPFIKRYAVGIDLAEKGGDQ